MKSPADFAHIFIINLEHRADRRKEISKQLALINLNFDSPNVDLFKAIRPSDASGFESVGARGCFLSHLGVLRQAMSLGNVLVLEDDLDFVLGIDALLQDDWLNFPKIGVCSTGVAKSISYRVEHPSH